MMIKEELMHRECGSGSYLPPNALSYSTRGFTAFRGFIRFLRWTMAITIALLPHFTHASTVAFAGFAYAGNANTIDSRYKFSRRYENHLITKGSDINASLRQLLSGRKYRFGLNMTDNADAKGDEALVTALMVTGETISEERFGSIHKLLIQVRAQTLIFDFKDKKIRRTYPLSFAYLDVLDHSPTDTEIDDRVAIAYEGAQGKPGILSRYAEALTAATLPVTGELFLQITNVSIAPDAQAAVPPEISTVPGAAESWLADHFDEALNSKAGIPLFPYTKGYAIGNVMAVRLGDADFNLEIPTPDWEISITLTGVRKVKYAENAAGTSYVYGAYATIKLSEQGGTRTALDAQFKNGEVKAVPSSQSYVDDLPAYNDSVRGLFDKLSQVLGGQDLPWLKSAAITPDIDKQIKLARGVLQQCK
jgi:hypothetical protein